MARGTRVGGGEKLAHALNTFAIDVNGRVAIDIGASTGGFTDVLLKAGGVASLLCGCGLWATCLEPETGPRVEVFDRTNARYITPDMFDPRPPVLPL